MKARFPLRLIGAVAVAATLVVPAARVAAAGVLTQGTEFALTVRIPGDQVHSRIALGTAGGWIVWQDAAIDGQGSGIAALRLDATHSPDAGGAFRVNETTLNDQENARVVLLSHGGAFFVWQSGPVGFPRIRGRVLGPDGVFATGDLEIGGASGEHQMDPEVAVMADGDVIVVWSSYRQSGVNYDVFGRRYSPAGEPRDAEFRVNQQLGLGRRSPTVAAGKEGGFTVAWVGERIVGERDYLGPNGRRVPGAGAQIFEVAVYTRPFDATGTPLADDQRVAGTDAIAAHPTLAPLRDGRLLLAWTRKDPQSRSNNLDVATRILNSAGLSAGPESRLNTFTYGDQYRPRLTATATGLFAVWSSMGQDGSREGVYGRWIDGEGLPSGDEMLVNSTVGGGQVFPATAATPDGRILVAWSSNLPRSSGLELFAQRFASSRELRPLPAPSVTALSSSSLMISWPPVAGLEVVGYRIYATDGPQLAEVETPFWILENLTPASAFSAEVAYVLRSGEVSPRSPAGTGTTSGSDRNFDGLPDDWQARLWPGATKFPAGGVDSDGDGVTNLDEWLAGTDPTDAGSSLKVGSRATPLGLRIEWPTQPGFIYQLQVSKDGRTWSGVGNPRFAADRSDSLTIAAAEQVAFYRVLRVR